MTILLKIIYFMNKPKIISIIGGTGQMGQKFAKEFLNAGFEVLVSGRTTKLTNKDVAKRGDVIIITVPIHKTKDVIEEIIPLVKEDALLTDFTSVKMMPIEVMTKSKSSITVVGGHPLFGPTTNFKNQNFIFCHERGEKYVQWYKDFLEFLGLNVLDMTKEEHDKHMAVIQCLTHFSALSLGSTLEKLNYDLIKGESIATPVYLMRFYGVGRILAQDPDLYTDIQMYNPFAKDVAKMYKKSVDELLNAVDNSDAITFSNIFNKSKKYFGHVATRSMEVTDKLIKSLS